MSTIGVAFSIIENAITFEEEAKVVVFNPLTHNTLLLTYDTFMLLCEIESDKFINDNSNKALQLTLSRLMKEGLITYREVI